MVRHPTFPASPVQFRPEFPFVGADDSVRPTGEQIHGIVAQLAERTAETAADGRRRFDPCRYHQFNVDTASEKRFSGKSFGRCEVLK